MIAGKNIKGKSENILQCSIFSFAFNVYRYKDEIYFTINQKLYFLLPSLRNEQCFSLFLKVV